MNRVLIPVLTAAIVAMAAGPAQADENKLKFCKTSKRSSVWAGFGYLNAQAEEIVYGGPGGEDGNEMSRLSWEAKNTPTFNLGFEGEMNDCWSLYFDGVVSMSGDDSNMVNTDYLGPTSDWTNRSTHPDTDLNHYVQIDFGLSHNTVETENFRLATRFGFRYTDISFDAFGGSGVASSDPHAGGFRDILTDFPEGINNISYRQKLPGIYFNPKASWNISDCFSIKVGATAGLMFAGEARDNHWLIRTLYIDDLDPTFFWGASLGAEYSLAECAALYVEGSYDHYTRTDAEGTVIGQFGPATEQSAAELETFQIRAGLKITGWHDDCLSKCW